MDINETEIRAERVKAGQMAAKARGKKWGGSKKGKRKGRYGTGPGGSSDYSGEIAQDRRSGGGLGPSNNVSLMQQLPLPIPFAAYHCPPSAAMTPEKLG